jgi:hypothetical protein
MYVIRGRIPRDLRGTYIKNGPSRFALDAPGFVQKIVFGDGVATYFGREVAVPPRPIRAFDGPWIPPLPCMLENAANTNIVPGSGEDKYWALYDGGRPMVIDANTLATEGEVGSLRGFVNSHPKGRDMFLTTQYILGGVATKMKFGDEIDFIHPGFVYIHDFFVTPRFIGFIDHKLRVDLSPFTPGGVGRRLRHTEVIQQLILIDRKNNIRKTIPLFDFGAKGLISHYVHTYEDVVAKTMRIVAIYYPNGMCGPGMIREMTVCLDRWAVVETLDIRKWAEFPTATAGGDLVYMSCVPYGGIMEYNVALKTVRYVVKDDPAQRFYAEVAHDPVGGYNMSYIHDIVGNKTTLAIYDDKTWTLECELGFLDPVFPGLHGMFLVEK